MRTAFIHSACVLTALLVLGINPPATAQPTSRFLDWAYEDGRAVLAESGPRATGFLLGAAGIAALAPDLDESVRRGVAPLREAPAYAVLDRVNVLGDRRMLLVAGGVFAGSLLGESTRFQDAAFTSLQAGLMASAATGAMKAAFGRVRPAHSSEAEVFEPFSAHTSFPSGHTTLALALTVPWAYYYPNPLTACLVLAGAGTGAARIVKNRHWSSDVVVGAAIGTLTAAWLARRHLRAADGPAPGIEPIFGWGPASGRTHLGVRVRFGRR